jgi:hypothetical protein
VIAIRNLFMALPMLSDSVLYCRQVPLWLHFGNAFK